MKQRLLLITYHNTTDSHNSLAGCGFLAPSRPLQHWTDTSTARIVEVSKSQQWLNLSVLLRIRFNYIIIIIHIRWEKELCETPLFEDDSRSVHKLIDEWVSQLWQSRITEVSTREITPREMCACVRLHGYRFHWHPGFCQWMVIAPVDKQTSQMVYVWSPRQQQLLLARMWSRPFCRQSAWWQS